MGKRTYRSIAEIRAAFYPRSAWLLDLPRDAIIVWPHWHHDSKRGRYTCTDDHTPGKRGGRR